MIRKTASSVAALLVLAGTSNAFATNGMNLEGYGSKSMALGGTGAAYDTGNSAVMNNPATLGFMKKGTSEIGFGIRGLHPDVELTHSLAGSDKSEATAFYMPSMSYMRRDGRITWGAAMLAQGGMGTDYGNDSPLFAGGRSMNNDPIFMSGEDIRSEVGVGRIMLPVAYQVNDKTTLGFSFDVVIASMDLQMDMDGDHFGQLYQGNGGSISGTMRNTMDNMFTGGMMDDINYARFDFSNDSPWTGKAMGVGTGLKFGFTHKVSKQLTVGASYHTQTRLGDLETDNAKLSFVGASGGADLAPVELTGKIKVRNFEWPATIGAGFAFSPSNKLMIAGDVKITDWSAVMDSFSTRFTADNVSTNGSFAGQTLDVNMMQDWDDQAVWSLGVQYMASKKLALRAGASFSTNPVPDEYLNPLFPAITTDHYTCGFGYRVNDVSSVSAAFSYVPEVKATSNDQLVISHSQMNWSLNYNHAL